MTTQPVSALNSSGPAHRPRRRRVVLLVVAIIGAMAAVHFSGLDVWLNNHDHVQQLRDSLGKWIYLVGTLAVALLVCCGAPRLLFCVVGGALLGFWPALFITMAGTEIGYYAAFLFIRWGGRAWVLHHFPKAQHWANLMHRQGVIGVILIRQLPVHGTLANLALGLSHVKHRHYLIGTAIGILPESLLATALGTGLFKASKHSPAYLTGAVLLLLVVWVGIAYILRLMSHSAAGAQLQAEAANLKGSET